MSLKDSIKKLFEQAEEGIIASSGKKMEGSESYEMKKGGSLPKDTELADKDTTDIKDPKVLDKKLPTEEPIAKKADGPAVATGKASGNLPKETKLADKVSGK